MSPLESAITLPCSSDSIWASASMFCSISALNRNITRARLWGFMAAQAGCAAFAEAIARSSCAGPARSTWAWICPVEGS
ncbi:hypothetical protein D3C87_1676240 [compost metagenome]